jgi:DNA-directed RNA polymerase subunit delta
MKRVIKDYNSITQEHIDLINEHYPNGFENENLVSFVTPKGQFIKALEVRTEDTIYLFKIEKNMKVADDDDDQDGDSGYDNFKSSSGGDDDDDIGDGGDIDSDDDDDDVDDDADVAEEDDGGDDD